MADYQLPFTGAQINDALNSAGNAVQREEGVNYGWIHISQADYEALVSAGTLRTDVQYLVDDEL